MVVCIIWTISCGKLSGTANKETTQVVQVSYGGVHYMENRLSGTGEGVTQVVIWWCALYGKYLMQVVAS